MKVSTRRGRVQLRLEQAEVALLESLFAEFAGLLNEEDASADPVFERLFPAGYADDAQAEADFRSLTHQSLRSERLDRIALCAGELARSGDVDLSDRDTGERWIKALNDLRLALGTRLGVTEDDYAAVPEDEPRLIYHWLTAVQDSVVTALMR